MGAAVSALAGAAKDFVAENVAPVAQKALRPMATEFMKSDAGKFLYDVLKNDFEPILAKAEQHITGINSALPAAQQKTALEIRSEARNIARKQALGQNDSLGAAAIRWAEHTNGPIHTQNLADHMAMYLQDTVHWEKTGMDVSSFKANVRFNKEYGTDLNINPVYTGNNSPEGRLATRLQSYASTILAPLIAIPHLSTALNYGFTVNTMDLAKALAGVIGKSNYRNTRAALLDTGIFADTSLQAYRELQEYRSGFISQVTGSPKLGYILGKAIHQPFFNALRDWTLAFGGATGKLHAERMAEEFAQTGSKKAFRELQELGIDPALIKAQGGKLNPDQLEKAVYHFVDNRAFLNNKLGRSYYASKSPLFRTALMFHNYVAAQGQLIKRETLKAFQNGDVGQIARWFTMMGIVYPTAGVLISNLESFARGTWNTDEAKTDFENMTGQNGAFATVESWLDAYAHIGGFGVATSYVRGATRNELGNSIVGPIGNVAVKDIQDAGSMLLRSGKVASGEKDASTLAAPASALGRDSLEQSLPDNMGKILAHQFIPTKAETKARAGGSKFKFRKIKSSKSLKKLTQ